MKPRRMTRARGNPMNNDTLSRAFLMLLLLLILAYIITITL